MPGKVKYNNLSESEKAKYLGDFYSMVMHLETKDEVKNFFKDLLSLSEIVMISRRIQVAKMLLKGATYDEIAEELRIGRSTIAQVDRWLNNGFDGYKKTISKQMKSKKNVEKNDYGAETPFSLDSIRKKYPAHFLLLNLLNKNK